MSRTAALWCGRHELESPDLPTRHQCRHHSRRAQLFSTTTTQGACQSQALVLRKAPRSSNFTYCAPKVNNASYTNKGRVVFRFFVCFFPHFSPIEKTRYRPKDLILEIGSGKIKTKGGSRFKLAWRFWFLYQDFFLGYHAASRSPRRKRTPRGESQ